MLTIEAYQIAEQINIKKFKADYKQTPTSSSSTELFYHLDDGSHICVLGYGVVAIAGFNATSASEFIKFLKSYSTDFIDKEFKDDFIVHEVKGKPLKINFNSVELPEITNAALEIIMLNIAQSVSLDFYEDLSNQIGEETGKLTKELEQAGKLKISKTNLLKFIGKTLNIKNSIIDNLYIFDAPEVVWENEDLNKVDETLKKSLDLKMRYRDIDYKLKIVQENLTLFTDLLQNKESNRMEIIVIVLILIEVVNIFLGYIFKFGH
jgi:required for meiotic nuclear division protein 1